MKKDEDQPSEIAGFEVSSRHAFIQATAMGVTAATAAPPHQKVVMTVFENQLEPFFLKTGESGVRTVRKAVSTIAMDEESAKQLIMTLEQALALLDQQRIEGTNKPSREE